MHIRPKSLVNKTSIFKLLKKKFLFFFKTKSFSQLGFLCTLVALFINKACVVSLSSAGKATLSSKCVDVWDWAGQVLLEWAWVIRFRLVHIGLGLDEDMFAV